MYNAISKVLNLLRYKILLPRLRSIYWSYRFRQSSPKALIYNPIKFTPRFVKWKENVVIFKNCRVEGISCYGTEFYSPTIIFHSGVTIQQNCHITCADRIEIGENTALANNVTVTDIDHPYADVHMPIEWQNLVVKPVKIGDSCKIYNNAVILQGTIIGSHCVVGANSVVKGIFPDFSIIVGVPARIVKRYDFNLQKWRETSVDGSFI